MQPSSWHFKRIETQQAISQQQSSFIIINFRRVVTSSLVSIGSQFSAPGNACIFCLLIYIYSFCKFHRNRVISDITFQNWLLLFSIFGNPSVLEPISTVCISEWFFIIYIYIYSHFIIYSQGDGNLSYFYLFASINSTGVSIYVHVFTFLGCISGAGVDESHGKILIHFLNESQTLPRCVHFILHVHEQCRRIHFPHYSLLVFSLAILMGMWWHLNC